MLHLHHVSVVNLYYSQTRYRNLNLARKLRPEVKERLYIRDDNAVSVEHPIQATTSEEAGGSQSRGQTEEKVPSIPARAKKEKVSVLSELSITLRE